MRKCGGKKFYGLIDNLTGVWAYETHISERLIGSLCNYNAIQFNNGNVSHELRSERKNSVCQRISC